MSDQALLARIAELEARLARLEGTAPAAASPLPATGEPTSRRDLLRKASLTAAGAAVASIAVARPAAAHDVDDVALAALNSTPASTPTEIRSTGGSPPVILLANDTAATAADGYTTAAIAGFGAGPRAGVLGSTDAGVAGVVGVSAPSNPSGGGVGVRGVALGYGAGVSGQGPGVGVYGTSTTLGVWADAKGTGLGMKVSSEHGNGLAVDAHDGNYAGYFLASNGDALQAAGKNGLNVFVGETGVRVLAGGTGVQSSATFAVVAAGASSALVIKPTTTALPTAGTNAVPAGAVTSAGTDTSASLWACTTAGTPGTWQRIAAPGTAGALTILPTPVRCLDTRNGQLPTGSKGQLAAGTTRKVDVKNGGTGVPSGATGVVCNVTVTATSGAGYLAVYPGDATYAGSSTLNWGAAAVTLANSTTVGLGTGEVITIQAFQAATDVIIDIIGYYL